MCRHLHVTLSAEDKRDVKKLSGVLIPVYASIVFAVIALIAVTGGSRHDELIASTAVSPAAR